MPPETDVAAKAEADAKKTAEELEAKKTKAAEREAEKAAAKADAEAKAKAKAEADAAAAAEDDDEDDGPTEEAKGVPSFTAAERQKVKQVGARMYAALRSTEIGLGDMPASVLAAHLLMTVEKAEHMGATQAVAWAKNFRQQYPIVWGALRIGHMMNFAAAARRSELRTGSLEELTELASAIRA